MPNHVLDIHVYDHRTGAFLTWFREVSLCRERQPCGHTYIIKGLRSDGMLNPKREIFTNLPAPTQAQGTPGKKRQKESKSWQAGTGMLSSGYERATALVVSYL